MLFNKTTQFVRTERQSMHGTSTKYCTLMVQCSIQLRSTYCTYGRMASAVSQSQRPAVTAPESPVINFMELLITPTVSYVGTRSSSTATATVRYYCYSDLNTTTATSTCSTGTMYSTTWNPSCRQLTAGSMHKSLLYSASSY